jgi:hypothetical protein
VSSAWYNGEAASKISLFADIFEVKVKVGFFLPVVCLNDQPAGDDEAGEIEDCGRFQEN